MHEQRLAHALHQADEIRNGRHPTTPGRCAPVGNGRPARGYVRNQRLKRKNVRLIGLH